MTRIITQFDPTPFYRNSLGFDRIFDMLSQTVDNNGSQNYPPYNIIKTGDESYKIELAVAGFAEPELSINIQDGELVVVGENEHEDPNLTSYLHQGISRRKFIRKFNLAEYVEVESASVVNGILTIDLVRKVPDAAKPKTVPISFK